MLSVTKSLLLIAFMSACCYAQDPVAVVGQRWERAFVRAVPVEPVPSGPARAMIAENKNFERGRREVQAPGALDPNELTVDGRSAAIEKAVQESRTPKRDDVSGYNYTAVIRNDSGKTVEIVFWEYRFTEIARPESVVRRQFLCAVKLKNGQQKELTAFSRLGPSDTIAAESVSTPDRSLLDEKVIINRVELADGAVMQRNNWKYDDIKKDVERVTSTPWGKEVCRKL